MSNRKIPSYNNCSVYYLYDLNINPQPGLDYMDVAK